MEAVHHGECVGGWQPVRLSEASLWRCDRCGACYPDRADVQAAVWIEMVMDLELSRLAEEGQWLLGRFTQRLPEWFFERGH